MGNRPYDNEVLAIKFQDQLESNLNLMDFCTVDSSLEGVAGMKKTVRIYKATNGTQELDMGEGNTTSIEVDYYTKTHRIKLLQNRFEWYDEEEMTDPNIVIKGTSHQADDMYNTMNRRVIQVLCAGTDVDDEGNPIAIPTHKVTAFDFTAFAQATGKFTAKNILETKEKGSLGIFAIVSVEDEPEIRINCGTQLQYVEAHVRTGYLGTIAGIPCYTSLLQAKGCVTLATKQAVNYLTKSHISIEDERDKNTRHNAKYFRKYGLVYLADVNYIVKMYKDEVASIEATYTGGNVKKGSNLSKLMNNMKVVATYTDGSTAEVSGYALSGEIVVGASTITVTYNGKTDTVSVTGE